ncbi:hypothetical protein LOK49_LG11G01437 [Camellia lanceoleosa]|uniref:Uncharacterized protein n=1 Tax=Camellia lanceoleosa TaxID=1840588 RepID=A0ACC0G3K1_9ERIC|nr:hypothetical protein LOK49_LG11G01437 [Camellia lanceoleosa]
MKFRFGEGVDSSNCDFDLKGSGGDSDLRDSETTKDGGNFNPSFSFDAFVLSSPTSTSAITTSTSSGGGGAATEDIGCSSSSVVVCRLCDVIKR